MTEDGQRLRALLKDARGQDYEWSTALICRAILDQEPETDGIRWRFAESLRYLGLNKRAEELLGKVETTDPLRMGRVALLRAQIAQAQGDAGKAEQSYCEATALIPEKTYAWVFYASFLTRQERWADACSVLERALSCEEDLDEVHFNLATIKLILGEHVEARKHLETAIQLAEGNYPEAQVLLRDIEYLAKNLPSLMDGATKLV